MKMFNTYRLNGIGEKKVEAVCKAFNRLSATLVLIVPPDEYATAHQHLQQAFFFALHGIGSLEENRVKD